MKQTVLAVSLLLAACSPSAEPPPANGAEPQTEAAAPSAVPPLAGSWTVTAINGEAPGQVWPMTVEASAGRFTLKSECRSFSWAYTQDRNLVRFTSQPGRDCARTRSPAELMVEKPVDLANIAMFTDEGRSVELSGPGGRVSMTRR